MAAALAACAKDAHDSSLHHSSLRLAGEISHPNIIEASGMAASSRDRELLWVLNDGGAGPVLYALDQSGRSRGSVTVDAARNQDWEDLASFSTDGTPYLLIADIGDNAARRDFVTLYIIEEPEFGASDAMVTAPHTRIDFRYPDGPRDAEAVLVDASNQRAIILSKRDIPAVFYEVSLLPATGVTTAKRLGPNGSLPPPSQRDVDAALRRKDWHWQPTAMDTAADQTQVAILTYRAAYVFTRVDDEDWLRTLRRAPKVYPLGGYREAEALAFSPDGDALYITVEAKRPPLLRIELSQDR